MRKIAVIMLALIMLCCVLSGCHGDHNKSTENTKDTLSGDSAAFPYPVGENGYPNLGGETIKIWFAMTTAQASVTDDLDNYLVIQEIEKKLNCNLEFIHPPVGKEKEDFSIMLADELPDIICTNGIDEYYLGGITLAYEKGVLYDYTDLISAENTPNFYNLIQDEYLADAVKDDSGRIIRLGAKVYGSRECDLTFTGPIIRKDYLAETGMDVPVTIDDWTKLFQKMKDNGVKYPLVTELNQLLWSNNFSGAFGITSSGMYLDEEGKVRCSQYVDAYKDYLSLLNQWYEAGYIHPDFALLNVDDVMSLATADQAGAVLMHLADYRKYYYPLIEGTDGSRDFVPANKAVMKEGDALPPIRDRMVFLSDYKYITADADNPQACVAFLDALYSEEMQVLTSSGIEGKGYDIIDGQIVGRIIYDDTPLEEQLAYGIGQFSTHELYDYDYVINHAYNMSFLPEAINMWSQQGTERSLSNFRITTVEEAKIIEGCREILTAYMNEMFVKFITGEESLDKFDLYQQKLRELHIEEYIAVIQAANDRARAR